MPNKYIYFIAPVTFSHHQLWVSTGQGVRISEDQSEGDQNISESEGV